MFKSDFRVSLSDTENQADVSTVPPGVFKGGTAQRHTIAHPAPSSLDSRKTR